MPAQLFGSVPEPERTRFLKACQPRSFTAGEVVFREGEPGDSLYLCARGRAIVRASTEEGDSVAFDIVGPGEVLGLLGMVRPEHLRTATVVALDDCLFRVMTIPVFDELRRRYPSSERALAILMADHVERLSQQLLEAHYLPVGQRIARRLLRVAEMGGTVEPNTVLPLTQHDVAALAGAARPTTNQALKKLEATGSIRLSRGRVEIADPGLLEQQAAG